MEDNNLISFRGCIDLTRYLLSKKSGRIVAVLTLCLAVAPFLAIPGAKERAREEIYQIASKRAYVSEYAWRLAGDAFSNNPDLNDTTLTFDGYDHRFERDQDGSIVQTGYYPARRHQ